MIQNMKSLLLKPQTHNTVNIISASSGQLRAKTLVWYVNIHMYGCTINGFMNSTIRRNNQNKIQQDISLLTAKCSVTSIHAILDSLLLIKKMFR